MRPFASCFLLLASFTQSPGWGPRGLARWADVPRIPVMVCGSSRDRKRHPRHEPVVPRYPPEELSVGAPPRQRTNPGPALSRQHASSHRVLRIRELGDPHAGSVDVVRAEGRETSVLRSRPSARLQATTGLSMSQVGVGPQIKLPNVSGRSRRIRGTGSIARKSLRPLGKPVLSARQWPDSTQRSYAEPPDATAPCVEASDSTGAESRYGQLCGVWQARERE